MIDFRSILSSSVHFNYNPEPPTRVSYYSSGPNMEYHPEPFKISYTVELNQQVLWFTWKQDGCVHKLGLIWD